MAVFIVVGSEGVMSINGVYTAFVREFSPCPCIHMSLVLKQNSGVEGFWQHSSKTENNETLTFEQGLFVVLTL